MKKIRAFLGFLSIFVFTIFAANPAFAANTCDAGYEYNAETGTCVEKIELCDEGSSCDTYTFFFFESYDDASAADDYSYPKDVIDDGLTPILKLTFDRDSTTKISEILNRDDVKAELKPFDEPYYIEQWVDNTGIYPSEDLTVQGYFGDEEPYYYHSSFYIGAELPECDQKTQYIKTDGTCGICPDGTIPSAVKTSFNNTCVVDENYYTCTGTFDPDSGNGLTCTAKEFKITYLANGKSIYPDGAPTTCTVKSGDIPLPTELAVDGYNFDGWLNELNVIVEKISKGNCTSDKTFTAKLTSAAPKLTYNLIFPKNTGFSGGTLTVTWQEGEEEKTETRPLATTIEQFITSGSYDLPEPVLPDGFKFNGWYSDSEHTNKIDTITKTTETTLNYSNVYGKVEPIEFKIIADCDLIDPNNNSIECSYNELKDFHDECNVSKLNDLCKDPNTNGYVLKVWKNGDEEIAPIGSYLGWLSTTDGDEITLNAIYAPQYNICIINPTDPDQCQKNATCFDEGEFESAVYELDVAAEGKVYSGAVKIGVGTSDAYNDAAKALSGTTPDADDERINFTCLSGLVNTADNTIYVEYQYCAACAENATADCVENAALNSCSYHYICNTGYTAPDGTGNNFLSEKNNKQCVAKTYNVYLNPKSDTCTYAMGTGVGISANVASGTNINTNDFSCSGKILVGWSTDSSATTKTYDADSIKLTEDDVNTADDSNGITLYAVWANEEYDIYYKKCTKDDPEICLTWVNEPTQTDYVSGETIKLPAKTDVTVAEHYELSGWQLYYNADLTQPGNTYTPGGSLTGGSGPYYFVPVIEPITYTMIPYVNNEQAGSPTNFNIKSEEGRLTTPPAREKAGYTFVGWCFDDTDTCFDGGVVINVEDAVKYASSKTENGTIKLNAKFEPNVYNLYIDYNDTTGGRKQLYVLYSQGIFSTNNNGTLSDRIESLPTPTRTGYIFTDYKNENGETIKYGDALYITENTEITAQWTPIVYPVNVNWNGNLIGVGDTAIFDDETIYEKFGTGWYSDEAATEGISQLDIPNNDTVSQIYTFEGLYIGDEQIFDKDGMPIVNNYTFNQNGTDKLTAKWVKNCYPVTLYDTNTATDDTSIEMGTIYRAPECTNGECENAWFSDDTCETSLESVTSVTLQDLYSFRGWNSANNWTFEDGETGMIFDEGGKPTPSANEFKGDALYSMESNKYTIGLFAPSSSGWEIPGNKEYVTYTASDAVQTIENLAYLYRADNAYIHVGWSINVDNTNCSKSPLSYVIQGRTAEDFILYPCGELKKNICLYDVNSISETDLNAKVADYAETSCTYFCNPGYYKSVAGQNSTSFTVQVGDITENQTCDPIEYTVTFNAGDGAFSDGGITKTTTVTFNTDTPDNLGNGYIPKLTGYTFKGWYYNGKMVYDSEMEPSSTTWIYSQEGSIDPNISLSPVWEANEYQINYNIPNDVTLPSGYATTCTPDADVDLPTPERTGYTFSGWTFNGKPIDKISANSGVCVKDLTLDANWVANKYSIAFDANGGTLNPSYYTAEFTYDAPLPDIDVIANRTDYILTGWFDKNGTKYYDANNAAVKDKSNLLEGDRLSAGWTKRDATQIELNLNGGLLNGYTIPTDCFQSSGPQELPTVDQVIAPVGYEFDGWTLDGTPVTNYVCDKESLTFTAQWKAKEFTVTFDGNGHTNGSMLSQKFVYNEPENLANNEFEKTGYIFSGWAESATGAKEYDNAAQFNDKTDGNNITLFAVWKPITYYVSFDGVGADGGTKMQNQQFTYDVEQPLTKNTYEKTGYKFEGWATQGTGDVAYENGASVSNLTNTENGTVNLYAVWSPMIYNISYDIPDACDVNNNMIEEKTEYNEEYYVLDKSEIPSIDCPGFELDGWKCDDCNDGTIYGFGEKFNWKNVKPGEYNIHLELILTGKQYTINYNCGAGSFVNGAEKSQTATMGQSISLLIGANTCQKPGYKFSYWTDEKDTKYNQTFNWMTADDVTLTPKYVESNDTTLVYPAEYNKNALYCNASTEDFSLGNVEKTGYTFKGWYICDTANHENPAECSGNPIYNIVKGECTFTSGEDTGKTMYLYPAFEPIEYAITFFCNDNTSGFAADTIYAKYEEEFTFPEYNGNCSDAGRAFIGWTTTSSAKTHKAGTKISLADIGVSSGVSLYAVWENIKYDITFDANGGVGTPAPNVSCEYDKMGCVAPGYNGMTNGIKYFVGWAYDKNATEPNFVENDALNTAFDKVGTHTLYAVWQECATPEQDPNSVSRIDISVKKNSCQYAAKCNEGYFNPMISDSRADCTKCPDNSSSSADNSAKYCTCKEYYEFGTNNQTTTNACSAKEYKIQYGFIDTANWDDLNLPEKYTYGIGAEIPQLSRDGYIFNGWCTDSAKTDCALTQTISDEDYGQKTFWANVQPIKFTITYDGNGGTTADGEPYSTECTYDLACQTAENKFINPGHKFVEWVLKDKGTFGEMANIENLYKTETVATMHATWDACTSLNDAECNCPAGTHPNNGECISCTKQCDGKFPYGEYNACAGQTNHICKRPMHKDDITNSIFVDGTITLGGMKDITQLQCADGYYPSESMDECLPCPAGSYCESGVGLKACPDSHPNSDAGASFDSECYKTCTDSQIDGFRYQAITDKAYFDTKCQYSKVVTSVGTCAQDEFDLDARTCNRYETCAPGYNLISGQCKPCDIENAVNYSSGCIVQTCTNGYHPFADTCVSNEDECTIENASIAIKTWNESKGGYGICTVVECDEDFHIENNTCVSNYRECKSANGYGTQEWQKNNRWGDCIATKCNAGYELNGDKCVPCSNSNGVSSWINGCTIAACMYQGEQYNLENNECIEICTNTTDYTGTRKWNSTTKRCETSCADGYKKW